MSNFNKRVTAAYCRKTLNKWFPEDKRLVNRLKGPAVKARYFAVRTRLDNREYIFNNGRLVRNCAIYYTLNIIDQTLGQL